MVKEQPGVRFTRKEHLAEMKPSSPQFTFHSSSVTLHGVWAWLTVRLVFCKCCSLWKGVAFHKHWILGALWRQGMGISRCAGGLTYWPWHPSLFTCGGCWRMLACHLAGDYVTLGYSQRDTSTLDVCIWVHVPGFCSPCCCVWQGSRLSLEVWVTHSYVSYEMLPRGQVLGAHHNVLWHDNKSHHYTQCVYVSWKMCFMAMLRCRPTFRPLGGSVPTLIRVEHLQFHTRCTLSYLCTLPHLNGTEIQRSCPLYQINSKKHLLQVGAKFVWCHKHV